MPRPHPQPTLCQQLPTQQWQTRLLPSRNSTTLLRQQQGRNSSFPEHTTTCNQRLWASFFTIYNEFYSTISDLTTSVPATLPLLPTSTSTWAFAIGSSSRRTAHQASIYMGIRGTFLLRLFMFFQLHCIRMLLHFFYSHFVSLISLFWEIPPSQAFGRVWAARA